MRVKPFEVIFLFVLAAVVAADGIGLAGHYRKHLRALEAGGYEILLSMTLAGLTVLYWRRDPGTNWVGGKGTRYVSAAFGILAGYAVLMPYLGYFLSTVLAVVAYMRILGGYRWLFSFSFSVTLALSSALLWDWLVIIVPQGIIPWP